ncbi:3-hydroxyacyl-[acyl-carrier-protein] dehydratase FabZ [Rubripirellula obstinata]|uniref:3-hydroxyacyl-[acyl-carrier-protein] dehydratase FabZ n=2 Tax=Rubripirellula obstinata TaxID=406547 RepID=A0A5B1CGH2_9BACT|nr:3-hydroxyacyl-[acyl-carrier-protein] dehydratase FabZ [Rubripirellula obstinata]
MLLVDEIIEETETTIVCKKTFADNEFFFQGHFPDSPIVPGVIQCECCLQSGALLLAGISASGSTSNDDDELPVATRMDSVKFKRMIRPGDEIEMHVTLNEQVSNASYLTGKILLAGKLAMRLDFSVTMSPAPTSSNAPPKKESAS